MPDLRTMQDVNAWLVFCGHCPFELVPEPRKDCQSLEGLANVDGFAPFIQPAGEPEEDLPTIYGDDEAISGTRYTGTGWSYTSGPGTVPFPGEFIVTQTVNWSSVPDEPQSITDSGSGNVHEAGVGCESSVSVVFDPGFLDCFSVDYTAAAPSQTCTADRHESHENFTSVSGIAGPFDLLGCPGPFDEDHKNSWNYTKQEVTGTKLLDPTTKPTLIASAIATLPLEWPAIPLGAECSASLVVNWPTIGDIGEWSACDDGPPPASGDATAIRARYRHGVPIAYPRSTYIAQWDDYFFPKAWDEWNAGGRVGTEPEPLPTLIAHRSWTWAGSLEEPWSEWFVIQPPETEGEVRSVNLMVKAGGTKYGNKPTSYGETYTPTTP